MNEDVYMILYDDRAQIVFKLSPEVTNSKALYIKDIMSHQDAYSPVHQKHFVISVVISNKNEIRFQYGRHDQNHSNITWKGYIQKRYKSLEELMGDNFAEFI
jgi:hypothetical protein